MAKLYSNEQKAILVVDDINENSVVYKQNCLDVQHFQYDCCRKLNQAGNIYGPMEPVILNFRVKVNSSRHTSSFYNYLSSKSRAKFSILFNVNYGDYNRLESYEDGLVVHGFVIGVKQAFSGGKNDGDQNSQMMLDVQVLVSTTMYLGVENSIMGEFIK